MLLECVLPCSDQGWFAHAQCYNGMIVQVCLPVKWLDLAYNLVKNHDGSSAFLVVDHDEEDMIAAKAPIGNIYAPGMHPHETVPLVQSEG